MVIEANSKFEATKSKCIAMLEEGRSEMKNLEGFDAQRKHEFEMNKAKVFEQLATNNKNIVISGDSGESIINTLFEV